MKIKPISVKPLDPYKIWIQFSDGVEGTVDYSKYANSEPFKAWNDLEFFNHVYLREVDNAVCWNDDLDFDSLAIYLKLTGKTFEEMKNKFD